MTTFRFKSIASRINIAIISFVIMAIFLISSMVIYNLISQTKEDYQRSINQQIAVLDHDISLYVKSIIDNTKMLANMPTIKALDGRITSYVNMTGENGVIPMTPHDNSPYESEVFKILEVFQTSHSNIRNASVGVESNGGFVKYPTSPRFDGYDARERSWYKAALDNLNEVTIPGIYKTSSDENVILSVIPVSNNDDEVVGVVSIDFELKDLSEILSNIKIGESGYVILTDGTGNILAHPVETDLIGSSIKETVFRDFVFEDKVQEKKDVLSYIDKSEYVIESIKSELKSFDLYYFIIIKESEYTTSSRILIKQIFISVMFLLLLVFIYSNWMSKRLSKPIIALTQFSDRLANGHLNDPIELDREDEIGQGFERKNGPSIT